MEIVSRDLFQFDEFNNPQVVESLIVRPELGSRFGNLWDFAKNMGI